MENKALYCLKGWHYRYGKMPIKIKSAFYSYNYGTSRKRSLKIMRMSNKRIPARVLKRVFVESVEKHSVLLEMRREARRKVKRKCSDSAVSLSYSLTEANPCMNSVT